MVWCEKKSDHWIRGISSLTFASLFSKEGKCPPGTTWPDPGQLSWSIAARGDRSAIGSSPILQVTTTSSKRIASGLSSFRLTLRTRPGRWLRNTMPASRWGSVWTPLKYLQRQVVSTRPGKGSCTPPALSSIRMVR
jgi:hypothetical protein